MGERSATVARSSHLSAIARKSIAHWGSHTVANKIVPLFASDSFHAFSINYQTDNAVMSDIQYLPQKMAVFVRSTITDNGQRVGNMIGDQYLSLI